jgi:hypothetical protein
MDSFAQALSDAIDDSGMRGDFIAKQIGTSANRLSQWKNGRRPVPAHYAPTLAAVLAVPPERISGAYAKVIEAGLSIDSANRSAPIPSGNVRIPRLADFGRPEAMDDCYLLEVIARRKLGTTPVDDCRWALQPNAAMSPLIERDCVLLIDTRITRHADIMDGAVYAFTLWGRSDVRRIFVRRDHLLLAAHNSEVERIEVHGDDLADLHLHGLVVGWL